MNGRRYVIIPFDQLSPEALTGVIEAYVTREGTDYGHGAPLPLETKVGQVRRQVMDGRAIIVFDAEIQSCNIIPQQDLPPDWHG
jgi:uncharacterized protein YheU (UPF0270 family)